MKRLALLLLPVVAIAGDFVTNPSATLPGPKTDARNLPVGSDPNKYLRATDYNAVRDAANDLRDYVRAPNDALVTSTGGTTARALKDRFADVVNARDFASLVVAGDWKPALEAAAAAAYAANKPLLLTGTFDVTAVVFDGTPNLHVQSEGANIVGRSTGNYDAIFYVKGNSPGMKFTGSLHFDGAFNLGYRAAFIVDASYVDAENVDFQFCQLAWMFGDSTVTHAGWTDQKTYGVYEITIRGGKTRSCIRAVEAWGANTVVHFSGFNAISALVSEFAQHPAGWDTWGWDTIKAIGAQLYFSGGAILNMRATYDHPAIVIEPIDTTDVTYTKPYGRVYVTGASIEVLVLAKTSNPSVLVSTDTTLGLSIVGSQGYVSGGLNFIVVDSTYKGAVRVSGCNFYAPVGTARTALTVDSASANAHVYVDDVSFGFNFPKGLNALSGGIVHFTGKQILDVRQSTTSAAAGTLTAIAFTTFDANDNSARFQATYNTTTGVFTVPAGGLRDVTIDATVVPSSPAASADMVIQINGVTRVFGAYTAAPFKTVRAMIASLASGDLVTVKLATNTGSPIAMDGGDYNRLTVTASLP